MRRSGAWLLIVVFAAALGCAGGWRAHEADRPNVLFIITDDQGWGDAGFHGNPVLRTPNLDRLAAEGVELTRFHVSPVCSPTRASLMTGRYNYRTGVVDTFMGRSMMHPDEVTLAEMLRGAGYATGLFGKWHLGDNHPLRAMDQGFDEVLGLPGGGLMQHSDPPGNNYLDPILRHNGIQKRYHGYCSDIFTDAAIDYIRARRGKPFLAWVAFNAPHTPLEAPAKELEYYKSLNLRPEMFPGGEKFAKDFDADVTARVYAMVENIDTNIGRLLGALDELGIAEDTIVVFMTDNGPQQARYNGGMRGLKGTTYEGGIRVPCLIRRPGRLAAGAKVDRIAAHIDITPTLLEWCGVASPEGVRMDGVSLAPLIEGRTAPAEWPDRRLFFQWHRGDAPEEGRACGVLTERYKLAQPRVTGEAKWDGAQEWQLFDLQGDPNETLDIATWNTEVAEALRGEYREWFRDVTAARRHEPPAIVLGSAAEPEAWLTRQDWRGSPGGNGERGLGHWIVRFERPGTYEIELRHPEIARAAETAVVLNGAVAAAGAPAAGAEGVRLRVRIADTAPMRLEGRVRLRLRDGTEAEVGAHFLVVRNAGDGAARP